jgi:ubiquinone/menaquinone biosynthesis C-methylase UbiE
MFQEHSQKYDEWFNKNDNIYKSELKMIESLIPQGLKGVEIGVGTGRFAKPLGINLGIEPAGNMAKIAESRGIEVIEGRAECLPFSDEIFDYVLMVTAICFFDDVERAFCEAHRVLKKDGFLIVAFIDKNSGLGKLYEARRHEDTFYKNADFYSVSLVKDLLVKAGFSHFIHKQTIYNTKNILHETKDGYGQGGFVAIKAKKCLR